MEITQVFIFKDMISATKKWLPTVLVTLLALNVWHPSHRTCM